MSTLFKVRNKQVGKKELPNLSQVSGRLSKQGDSPPNTCLACPRAARHSAQLQGGFCTHSHGAEDSELLGGAQELSPGQQETFNSENCSVTAGQVEGTSRSWDVRMPSG